MMHYFKIFHCYRWLFCFGYIS